MGLYLGAVWGMGGGMKGDFWSGGWVGLYNAGIGIVFFTGVIIFILIIFFQTGSDT